MNSWLLDGLKIDLTLIAVHTIVLPKTVGKKSVLTVQTKVTVNFRQELTSTPHIKVSL